MDRWLNRVAVVTGASSGIGSAICVDLVKAGLIVVGMARREDRLKELKSKLPGNLQGNFYPLKCDITKEDEVRKSFEWVEKNLKGVDVLVNNAGTYVASQLCLEEDMEKVKGVFDLNVMGLMYCTREAFKSMKKRNVSDGHVFLINSIIGHKIPSFDKSRPSQLGAYPASKFAVTALNEIYRQEFYALGLRTKITSISPGLVATEIVPEEYRKKAGDVILNPEDISQGVLYALGTGPHVQVTELTIVPVGSPL